MIQSVNQNDTMDDGIIKIDTVEAIKDSAKSITQTKTFKLVDESDPILHEVTPEFNFQNPPVNPNEFASSLVDTCRLHKGLGLAAPQCGFKYRVFVMGTGENYVAFYNPKIKWKSEDDVHLVEGCLSYPFLSLHITRPSSIVIEYQDFTGQEHEMRIEGLTARCFLHELDHLNGITFDQVAKPLALQLAMKHRTKQIKKKLSFKMPKPPGRKTKRKSKK